MMSALARFEQYLNRRFSHSSTPIHYLSDLRIFIRSHGDEPPETITAADIDFFVDAQLKAGLSISTVNRRLASLHTFFEFLAGENLEDSRPNPVIKRRHALKTGFRLPRDASDEEVARIFAVMKSARDEAMFGLMVGAGLRVGEVAALCLADIEEPSAPDSLARLTVRGKGNKERIVRLTDSLWNNLKAWLRERPETESDQVFLNWRGCPITKNGIQYVFKRHSDDAGVTLSCHRLRHTYARRLAESGLPVESLARLLGHTLLQTTQRYIDGANPAVSLPDTPKYDFLKTDDGVVSDIFVAGLFGLTA
jgi:site-specific recombinase XerD